MFCWFKILVAENEAARGTTSVSAGSANQSSEQGTFTGNMTSYCIVAMIVVMNVQVPPSQLHKQDPGMCMLDR